MGESGPRRPSGRRRPVRPADGQPGGIAGRSRGAARDLNRLKRRVIACARCPRLVGYRERIAREKVRRYREWDYWGRPVPSFGDPAARLLVVGLAPAAHGGNRTGRIFTGDESGNWLYRALYAAGFANQPCSRHRDDGLRLTDCYITAAIHCAPPANKPSRAELLACRPYLIEELTLLPRVRVILALGGIAFRVVLQALSQVGMPTPRPAPRFGHGAEYVLPGGRVLLASYHPSQQNTHTGRLTRRMLHGVFRRAAKLLREASG
ncbi:MAG: uracil-DNA glycosylase [Deltaproteobacteria bacterium]|nr:uracil-DNA glycosylase [Deltaproteobacteria bacterium]MBI3076583.1 uracil-DNA glycosylase [Deltaproteobacteria bacterium]